MPHPKDDEYKKKIGVYKGNEKSDESKVDNEAASHEKTDKNEA